MNAMIVSERIPLDVRGLMAELRDAGFDAVLVGGAVRDLAMNLTPKDWDVATSATPEEMFALFGKRCKDQKREMGTVQVDGHEVTTFRREGGYDDGRHPGTVLFTRSVLEDLARRDFTCNAIALRLVTAGNWCIIDPFRGLADIDNKILLAVGNESARFAEDHLRILRAVRFAGRYGWYIAPTTMAAMRESAPLLRRVSQERVLQEMTLILRDNPQDSLPLLRSAGVVKSVFPMLAEMVGCTQNTHHDFDVWMHAVMATAHMAHETRGMDDAQRDMLLWSALLHDCGKPATRKQTQTAVTFLRHEIVGAKMADAFCRQWKFSNEMRTQIVHLVREHMWTCNSKTTPKAVRRFVQRVGEDNIPNLLLLRIADNLSHRRGNKIGTTKRPSYWTGTLAVLDRFCEDREAGLAAVTVSHLALDGNDIMRICTLSPCKRVGDLQKQMLEMVLDDCNLNTVEFLTAWLEAQKEA